LSICRFRSRRICLFILSPVFHGLSLDLSLQSLAESASSISRLICLLGCCSSSHHFSDPVVIPSDSAINPLDPVISSCQTSDLAIALQSRLPFAHTRPSFFRSDCSRPDLAAAYQISWLVSHILSPFSATLKSVCL